MDPVVKLLCSLDNGKEVLTVAEDVRTQQEISILDLNDLVVIIPGINKPRKLLRVSEYITRGHAVELDTH